MEIWVDMFGDSQPISGFLRTVSRQPRLELFKAQNSEATTRARLLRFFWLINKLISDPVKFLRTSWQLCWVG